MRREDTKGEAERECTKHWLSGRVWGLEPLYLSSRRNGHCPSNGVTEKPDAVRWRRVWRNT